MDEPKLIEFENAKRFTPSTQYKCPQCGGVPLRDDWPPNYGGGSVREENGIVISESGGNVKHVCVPCRISFIVSWWEKYVGDESTRGHQMHDIKPLIERDGFLLTPKDAWQYEYKDKHGVWPQECYL